MIGNAAWERTANPHAGKVQMDAAMIEGFVKAFLLDTYDEVKAIPPVHREWWEMVTDPYPYVVIAAPRSHGKSTALNHAYGLAASLFKQHPFQVKVSRTYKLAVEKLRQAKEELLSNQRIKAVFQLKKMVRDTEDDFIAEMSDGYRFRMIALGMGQAVRGFTWGTFRPSLFNVDDAEDDEQVLNPDSRDKTMNWFLNTLIPMGADNAIYRIYGTILHNDSALVRFLKNDSWHGKIFQACDEDITQESILWPQKFSKEKLQFIKTMAIRAGKLDGFNREYRNIATDTSSGFFREDDFRPMTEEDEKKLNPKDRKMTFYVGGDFAISTKQARDRTVFTVGGVDDEGFLHVVDERSGRWDAKEIIDEMFSIEEAWHPDEWYVESGAILKALAAGLEMEQRKRNVYLNLKPIIPLNDKQSRARSIQARMRSHAVRFSKDASWFPELKDECLQFPRGEHDDRVDALAYLGIGLARMVAPLSDNEQDEEDLTREERRSMSFGFDGRSSTTGY